MSNKFFNPQAVKQRLCEKMTTSFLPRIFLILCISFLNSYGAIFQDEVVDAAAASPKTLEEFLKGPYPRHNFDIITLGNYSFVRVCDPEDVKQQIGLIVQHPSTGPNDHCHSYLMHVVCTGKSDSILWSGRILQYTDLDDTQQVMKIKINRSSLEIVDVLPKHDGISHWDKISFDCNSDILFAKHLTQYGRLAEYWTIQTSDSEVPQWIKICDCNAPGEFLEGGRFGIHRFSYHGDNLLTIEHYNKGARLFEPTNVTDLRVNFIDTDALSLHFKTSHHIYCVKDYGRNDLIFLDELSTPATRETIPSAQRQHAIVFEKLRAKWAAEVKPYADLALSIRIGGIDHSGLFQFAFQFKNSALEGCVKFVDIDSEPAVEWRDGYDGISPISTHPHLQLKHASVSGHDIPYYYVSPKDVSNQKTLVLMEGGPESSYDGGFFEIIRHFTMHGWSIIIPQESLRTGYGWKHYEKGLGEMGRGNLHQLLHIFYDAGDNGLAPDIHQLYLYGHSYGGFVAASLALRMDELHSECGLTKALTFQSIIADAAMVDFSESTHDFQRFSRMIVPDGQLGDAASYIKKIMPIHRVDMPLCAPLTLVHGRHDVRCSADHARTFANGLNAVEKRVPLYWHQGDHCSSIHVNYPEFLRAVMERDTGEISRLASESGLELHMS